MNELGFSARYMWILKHIFCYAMKFLFVKYIRSLCTNFQDVTSTFVFLCFPGKWCSAQHNGRGAGKAISVLKLKCYLLLFTTHWCRLLKCPGAGKFTAVK